ncbi:MAG: hypothetical protein RI894_755 [Bacteroidota bacterium]|jgi:hypothetical protein
MNKRFIGFFFVLLSTKAALWAQGQASVAPSAVETSKAAELPKAAAKHAIEWNVLSHDFGDIPQGHDVTFEFKFTNNTPDSILIDNIRTTCGCTAASWQESAIQPGQTSIVPVQFDAHEIGYFEKTIKVYLNSVKKPFILIITGEVKETH